MPLISPFGASRPHTTGSHMGADYSSPIGTPIYSNISGTVTRISETGNYGVRVEIRGADGNIYELAHLDATPLSNGDTVSSGTLVAYSGNSGNAINTQPHTHYEVRPGDGSGTGPHKTADPESTGAYEKFGVGAPGNTMRDGPNAKKFEKVEGYDPKRPEASGAKAGGKPGAKGPAKGAGGKGGAGGCIQGSMPGTVAAGVTAGLMQGKGLAANAAMTAAMGALSGGPMGAIQGAMGAGMGAITGQISGALNSAMGSISGAVGGALSGLGANLAPGLTGALGGAFQNALNIGAGQLMAPLTSIMSNPLNLINVAQQISSKGGIEGFAKAIGANMVGNFVGGSINNLFNNVAMAAGASSIAKNIVGSVAEGMGARFGSVAGGYGPLIKNMEGLLTYGISTIGNNIGAVAAAMIKTGKWDTSNLTRLMQPSNIAVQILSKGLGDVTGLTQALANNNVPLANLDSPLNDAAVKAILANTTSTAALNAVVNTFGVQVGITNLAQLTDMTHMFGADVVSGMGVNNFSDLGKAFIEGEIIQTETFDEIGVAFAQIESARDLNHVIQMPTPMHQPSADLLLDTWGYGSGTFGEVNLADCLGSATGHVHEDTVPVMVDRIQWLSEQPEAERYFELTNILNDLFAGQYFANSEEGGGDGEEPSTTQTIVIPDIGEFTTLDDAVIAIIAEIEAELQGLVNSSNPDIVQAIQDCNDAHDASTAQVLREIHFWSQFDHNILEPTKVTPLDAYTNMMTITEYALQTGYGNAADCIERLCTDDFYGDSIKALMIQTRNAQVAEGLGINTDKFYLPNSLYYTNPLEYFQEMYTTSQPETSIYQQVSFDQYPTTIDDLVDMEVTDLLTMEGYDEELATPYAYEAYSDLLWKNAPEGPKYQIGATAVGNAIDRNMRIVGDKVEIIDLNSNAVPLGTISSLGLDNFNESDFLAIMYDIVNKILYGNIATSKFTNPFYTDELIQEAAGILGSVTAGNVDELQNTNVGSGPLSSFLSNLATQFRGIDTVNDTRRDRNDPLIWGSTGPGYRL